ncbi:MAG: ATP-grasp domain-containing protein [Gammaproteobacteria bacterium]|nr:ATP-grasp domain-containing protein [Gammaproteobacteria bacterium]
MLVNEIAPRTHNSGHYTIEACVTDQFGAADPGHYRPAAAVRPSS